MPKVLITGASGSIGGKLREHFSSLGWNLCLIDSRKNNRPDGHDVIVHDLSVYDESWAKLFANIDSVIHLAADPKPTSGWDSIFPNNITLTENVLRAACRHHARRVIFASSNWVMAGYRFDEESRKLTTDLKPRPINPYGFSKLFGERMGFSAVEKDELSFIALRIGWCQHTPGNRPGPDMGSGEWPSDNGYGIWPQQMWLSDRDLCNGMERAVLAKNIRYAVLNLMSDNPGMRWDIETTKQEIGYKPQDGQSAVETEEVLRQEEVARKNHNAIRGYIPSLIT